MNRIDFIKSLALKTSAFSALACVNKELSSDPNKDFSIPSTAKNNCDLTVSETAGPFPTKLPANFKFQDIRIDRKGIPLTINLEIKSAKTNCPPINGATVDIWHCDAEGNYSQYGSSSSSNFLRGRQITDTNGKVGFMSIFPGWYPGRATHIHIHIFNDTGKSLLVSQIAFPNAVSDTVFENATQFYKDGKQDTTNERDGIFRDGISTELAGISGSIEKGFILEHTIVVNA